MYFYKHHALFCSVFILLITTIQFLFDSYIKTKLYDRDDKKVNKDGGKKYTAEELFDRKSIRNQLVKTVFFILIFLTTFLNIYYMNDNEEIRNLSERVKRLEDLLNPPPPKNKDFDNLKKEIERLANKIDSINHLNVELDSLKKRVKKIERTGSTQVQEGS